MLVIEFGVWFLYQIHVYWVELNHTFKTFNVTLITFLLYHWSQWQFIFTIICQGYQIPEGWTILYSIRDNHQAEENYQSASEFNPDRWTEPDDGKESWMPFGGQGIRSCIAQNFNKMFFKQFIALLVKNCEWEIHQTQPRFSQFPVLIPKTELPIVFYPRKLPRLST